MLLTSFSIATVSSTAVGDTNWTLIFSEAAALMKPICDSPTASSVAMIPTEEKWLASATWSTVASTAAPAGAT